MVEQTTLGGCESGRVSLAQLRVGDEATFHSADLHCDDCDMLNAMGLTGRCQLRICKAGDPWIVQVRSTRIGLSKSMAKRIHVVPFGARA